MSLYTIIGNLPAQRKKPYMRTASTYPFHELHEGQSFMVPSTEIAAFPRIRSAASYYSKTKNVVLRCYTTEEGNLQVYRDLNGSGKYGTRVIKQSVPPLPPGAISITASAIPVIRPDRPSAHLIQMELPVGERIQEVIIGPTRDQWASMLNNMAQETSIYIESTYISLFKQMIAWTIEHAASTVDLYTGIVVGNRLQVSRFKCEPTADEFDDTKTYRIENTQGGAVAMGVTAGEMRNLKFQQPEQIPIYAGDGNIEYDVVTAEQLAHDREQAAIAINKDGWTSLPCKSCAGNAEGCVYCSHTGRHYDAAQDERVSAPAPDERGDLAGIARSIDILSKTRFAPGTNKDNAENYE